MPQTTEHLELKGESAIIVERYYRQSENGFVTRLRQENLRHALSCLLREQIRLQWELSCTEILEFITSTGTTAQENAARFLQMPPFNYLVVATDAHAKDYSILLAVDDAYRLAPMYDVASIAPNPPKRPSP